MSHSAPSQNVSGGIGVQNRPYSDTVLAASRKVMFRLMPFLMLMYIIAFLDRTNIGFAEQSLEIHAGISTAAYAFGAGLFFVGYAVFEVPSNLLMHKVGARWWLARIMVTWGLVAAGFMFVNSTTSFYILRFLLGVAEAGFFPGVILYLTYWFPRRLRGNATSLFYIGLPISQVIGGVLSGALLQMDGIFGLMGHQWMFMIEGLVAVVVGIIVLFYLTDRPEKAQWLTEGERKALIDILEVEHNDEQRVNKIPWYKSLTNSRVLYFCLIYFMIQIAVYGLTFFLPKQVSQISGYQVGFIVGLLTAIPWLAGALGNVIFGKIADRSGMYRTVSMVLLCISGAGLCMAAIFSSPIMVMVGLCLAALGFCASQPIFWNIPTSYLTGSALAAAVGLINGIGNLGGFLAPNLRVWTETTFGSPVAGLYMLGVCPFIAALLIMGTRMFDREYK